MRPYHANVYELNIGGQVYVSLPDHFNYYIQNLKKNPLSPIIANRQKIIWLRLIGSENRICGNLYIHLVNLDESMHIYQIRYPMIFIF